MMPMDSDSSEEEEVKPKTKRAAAKDSSDDSEGEAMDEVKADLPPINRDVEIKKA